MGAARRMHPCRYWWVYGTSAHALRRSFNRFGSGTQFTDGGIPDGTPRYQGVIGTGPRGGYISQEAYIELRVVPDGRATVVGLRDREHQPLATPAPR